MANDCKKIFGTRLKELRIKAGLSQDILAQKLKVSKSALGYYENAGRTPDIDILDKVAKYFDVSLDYLMGYSENLTTDIDLKSVCKYTGLSEKAIKSTTIAKELSNKRLHDTIEFILEDLFKEVEGRKTLTYKDNSNQELPSISYISSECSQLITALALYFSVELTGDPLQSYLLVSPDGHFIDKEMKDGNLFEFPDLLLSDKKILTEKIYYDEVCSAIKKAKKLYLEKKDGDPIAQHNSTQE